MDDASGRGCLPACPVPPPQPGLISEQIYPGRVSENAGPRCNPMPLSEEEQDAFVAGLVGSETAPRGQIDYVSTRSPWPLLTPLVDGAAAPRPPGTLRMVAISDTHERHHLLDMPSGDVLVHSGDILLFNSSYSPETSLRKLGECNHRQLQSTAPFFCKHYLKHVSHWQQGKGIAVRQGS